MRVSATSFKRLGLCSGAIIILVIYATASAAIRLRFYLPIGLLILSLYIWFMAAKCKGIYPLPAKAIGQLSLTFLLVGLSTSSQLKNLLKTPPPANGSVDGFIYTAAIYNAEIAICSTMTIGLFVLYLVLKRKEKKGMATKNRGTLPILIA